MPVVLVILYLPVGIENYYRYYNVYQVENECEGFQGCVESSRVFRVEY